MKNNIDNIMPAHIIAGIIVFVLVIIGLTWAIQGNDFLLYKYFSPKQEQVRRQTFEESKAYNDGMAQEIRSAQLDYIKANPAQKEAIASVILHRVANYDINKFPPDVIKFINEIKASRNIQ